MMEKVLFGWMRIMEFLPLDAATSDARVWNGTCASHQDMEF